MIMLPLLAGAALGAAAPTTVAALKWQQRVLLVSTDAARDPRVAAQRRILRAWKAGADERELVLVEVIGDQVTGATDTAAALRRRYRLPARGFAVVLIGKDGGAKLRDERPIAAATLEETIDAMPMRRTRE